MADLRDYTKKNTGFSGTDGIRLPSGNNAQRTASSNVAGTLRFNTDIDGIETYTSAGWRPLAAPPSISTVTPSTFSGESGTQFTINGEGFTPDAQVYFVTSNSTALLAATVSYYSAVQVRATTPRAIKVEEEPISVRVVQQSGTTTKVNCIDAGGVPSWITTGGALGSIFGANVVNVYVTATDPEGTAISYQLASGSLPNGLSLSANGLIQGLASSVLANTLYNFVIKANDTVNNNTDRSFSYTVLNRPPVINTAAGSLGTIYSGNAVPTSTISAYDPDGGQLVYSISSGSLPANTGLGSANGVIQGTPFVVTTNTTYTIGVTVTDEGSLTASNSYSFTVLNRPPLWNTDSTLTSANAESFTPITINAYDPDGESVTYTLTSGSVPSGLTFVSANATITGTAQEVDSNTTSTFTVTATDVGNDANARTFNLTITPIVDANFANTVLLLKTTNSNTIIKDASSNNLNLVVAGDSRATNFSPYNTSWSNSFDGNGDNLATSSYVPITWLQNASPTGTIEAFVYLTGYRSPTNAYQQPAILGLGATYLNLGFSSSGNLRYYWWNGSAGAYITSSATVPLNTWTHVAITFNAGNVKLWINGNDVGSGTVTALNNGSGMVGNLCIGSEEGLNSSSGSSFLGYISNLRIANNTVYSANFTPSATSLTITANTTLLSCHTNRFVNEANTSMPIVRNNDVKVVGWSPFAETDTSNGSMYFDGTGDYVQMMTPYNFGSNNFTVEGWFYLTNITSAALWGGSNGGGIVSKFQAYISSGTLGIDLNGSSVISVAASSYLKPYSWNHIAVCRGGTSTNQSALFINGVRAGTGTIGSQTGVTTNWGIGYMELGAITASYISDFRIVDGTDVYGYTNTTYTVPTTPLSNIANTKLLTLQNRQPHNNNVFVDKSRNKTLFTRNGNATQGTFTPFSAEPGKWSVFFDGSSDALTLPDAAKSAMGGGFANRISTMEAWIYPLTSGNLTIIGRYDGVAENGRFYWSVNSGNTAFLYTTSTSSDSTITGTAGGITANKWSHVAIVIDATTASSSTVRMYYNGNLVNTFTGVNLSTHTSFAGSNPPAIGTGTAGAGTFNGYISNFRFVANTAVYTTSFTPPTQPLTAITNTALLLCSTNQFIDRSTANNGSGFTITRNDNPFIIPFSPFAPNTAYTTANNGGGLYLDGSGDYLLSISNDNHAFRTSPFTIEAWHYGTTTSGGGHIISSRSGSINDASTITAYVTGGQYSFYGNGNHVPANYVTGQWNHVLYTRDASSTLRLFINGKLANYSDGYTPDITAKTFAIGSLTNGGEIIPATYISDIRLVNGFIPTSYQTSSKTIGTQIFTPPTAPLTISSQGAQSNAVCLLMNFTDAALIDYTGKVNFETVGDARANSSNAKFGTTSFSAGTTVATGSYLATNDIYLPEFKTGDFTIEAWVYLNTLTSDYGTLPIIGYGNGGANGPLGTYTAWQFNLTGSGSDVTNIRLYRNTTLYDEVIVNAAYTFAAQQWYHVSMSRSGSSLKTFVNGNQVGSTATSTTDYSRISGTNRLLIGTFSGGGGNNHYYRFPGLISDVRVTRSARYTANFTPPTRSFPNR